MSSPPARLTRDLQRDVHCLFGLPVDNLTMAQTKALLRERCTQEGNTVLATINVNWVTESFRDPTFREAIINSDLVVLDGKPLLWLSRLLGCPMRETVPGSTLIQQLLEEPSDQPLSIFLFGGEGEAAERAMQRINERKNSGLRAVGALNPGFGTVEEMSSEAIIEAINATSPDILLVALGAKKGTRWIERNRDRLNAKIISHLGATVNFLAGTVKRAPEVLQRLGLEWVWRIVQEPKLFSRYAIDGRALAKVVLGRLPLWVCYRVGRLKYGHCLDERVLLKEDENAIEVSLPPWPEANRNQPLRAVLNEAVRTNKELILDFQATKNMDESFFGLLVLLEKHLQLSGHRLTFINVPGRVEKMCRLFGI